MTVSKLRTEMSAGEYARWSVYYARQAQRMELAAKSKAAKHGQH